MQEKIDNQASIISQQQLFLDSAVAKRQETNIVTGVPDDIQALDWATNDDKIGKLCEVICDNTGTLALQAGSP